MSILVACIGNIFLGDDGFGMEVYRRLAGRTLPNDVRVVDFGIRGFDLALALLDEATESAILVDAVPRGEPAGTLYVIEPEWEQPALIGAESDLPVEPHSLDPSSVFRLVLKLGGRPKRVLLVGCEPTPWPDDDDPPMELSAPVSGAIDEAVRLVEASIVQLREEHANCSP